MHAHWQNHPHRSFRRDNSVSIRTHGSNRNGNRASDFNRPLASRLSPLSRRCLSRHPRDPDSVGRGQLADLFDRTQPDGARLRRTLAIRPDDGLHAPGRPPRRRLRPQIDPRVELFGRSRRRGPLCHSRDDRAHGRVAVLHRACAVRRRSRFRRTRSTVFCSDAGAGRSISAGRRLEFLDIFSCCDRRSRNRRRDLHSRTRRRVRGMPDTFRKHRDHHDKYPDSKRRLSN
jgi:hypothetical protein